MSLIRAGASLQSDETDVKGRITEKSTTSTAIRDANDQGQRGKPEHRAHGEKQASPGAKHVRESTSDRGTRLFSMAS